MPTFDTPMPISVTIQLAIGDVRITASARADTAVEVRPRDGSAESIKAAEQTRVEFSNGQLTIKTPKRLRSLGWSAKEGSVEVSIELPEGSHIHGSAAMGTFRGEGRLGRCDFKTATGDIALDRADGDVDLTTASGDIRIAEVDGHAVIKNGNGDIWIGHIVGDLRLSTANGNLAVDRAGADINARTANGNISIGEVVGGSVELNTASGDLEVGIANGTAAWLDVSSWSGNVRNLLEAANGPEPTDRTVEVRARTYDGDIVIRRS